MTKKSVFRLDETPKEEVVGGFKPRSGFKYVVGDIEDEMLKSYSCKGITLVNVLYSLTNRQARLLTVLHTLSRGGTCGIMVKGRIASALSRMNKSHFWKYLNQLKRLHFIGVSEETVMVSISQEDVICERVRGRVIWIEKRGMVAQDTEDSCEEEDIGIPPEIKTIIVYNA